jgi:hypothetical protein
MIMRFETFKERLLRIEHKITDCGHPTCRECIHHDYDELKAGDVCCFLPPVVVVLDGIPCTVRPDSMGNCCSKWEALIVEDDDDGPAAGPRPSGD